MVDITEVSTIVAAVSVIIGVVFTVMEIRHLARTRRTDVILKIYDRFCSREMVEAMYKVGPAKTETFQDYTKKYGLTEVTQIAVLFEGLGALLEQNLIDIKLVDSLFGSSLNLLWDSISHLIYGMRESLKEPFFFSHFEYLHNRLITYRKRTAKT
ncbi:MAG: hypothetical protein WED07_04020 [Candidatus Freyarchaeum deiterrae]